MKSNKKSKVLLVDDHTLFRKGLRFLIDNSDNLQVVGEATDGLSGVKMIQQCFPDIVLLDLDMPDMSGIEALPLMLNHQPDLAVIMLTVSEDAHDLTEAMRLGASGYLLKNIDTQFLLNSIQKVLEGENVLSPEMTSKLINQFRHPTETAPEDIAKTLTTREKEILKYLVQGGSNKAIANQLDVTESTIKVHVQNILRKLNLNSRVQAAVYAIEHGLHL